MPRPNSSRLRRVPLAGRACALLLAVLPSCGGGGDGPSSATTGDDGGTSGVPSSASAGTPPRSAPGRSAEAPLQAGPVGPPDASQRPGAPARVFASRYATPGPWYADLSERLDPLLPRDPWQTEAVANVFRRLLLSALEAGGTSRFGELCQPATQSGRLRPAELTVLRAGGALVVRGGTPGDVSAEGADAAMRAVAELVAPHAGAQGARAEVWITACWASEPGVFELRGTARLASERGPGALQTNVGIEARLRAGEGRLVLERLTGRDFVEVEAPLRPFREATRGVFGAAQWLGDAALVRAGRTDRLVFGTDVFLGMHGIAVGDVDGDGLEDVYVGRQGGLPNLLLRHLSDGTVQDVAGEAGADVLDDTGGVLIVDLDGDGARDIALGSGHEVVLLWNDGEGRFPAHSVLSGASRDRAYSLAAADADGDGDLDLYDARYFTGEYGGGAPSPYHDAKNGARNAFWRNEGERRFVDATDEVGLDQDNDRFSLSLLWEDVDGDGDQDLYVVNDFGRNNLYRNEGGRFHDGADECGLGDMAAGMGISGADVDLDGRLDLYISNMFTAPGARVTASPRFMPHAPPDVQRAYQHHTRGNSLLVQDEHGKYHDVTEAGSLAPGGWAWGSLFFDLENDGLPDVFVPNGFTTGRDPRDLQSFFWRVVVNRSPLAGPGTEDYLDAWRTLTRLSNVEGYSFSGHERDYAYANLGGRRFADASAAAGLDVEDDARAVVRIDWDSDGRQDLFVKNRSAPLVRFFRNVCPDPGAWFALELRGVAPNPDAIGARVELVADGVLHQRTVHAGEGFLAGSSARLHFGLGGAARVERLRVRWPDGGTTELTDLPLGGPWRLARGAEALELLPLPAGPPLDGREGPPLPSVLGAPDARVVALERLPYSGFPLPRFGAAEPDTVADHAGRPLYVPVWGSWEPAAQEWLAGLRALEGVDVHPLALDGPRDEAYARAVAVASGLANPGGRADRRTATLIEIALQAVLPAYDDLPLPVGLLFDPRGRLCVVTVGPLDVARIAEDARLASRETERDRGRWTTAITGGRWLRTPPARPLEAAIGFLRRERGEDALADELEAFHSGR